jgi:hypothetical protein
MKRSIRPGKSVVLCDSIQQQLNKYALAAAAAGVGMLTLGRPAQAEIVYTPADTKITPDHVIPLDLANNGTVDFHFKDIYRRSGSFGFDHSGILSILPAIPDNKIEGFHRTNGNYASALRAGVSIGSNAKFTTGANQVEKAFIDTGGPNAFGTCYSTWPSGKSRYLGLKFVMDGGIHFGWARLTITCVNLHVAATFTGYAYETVPNKAIIAGQESGADEEAGVVMGASVGGPVRKTAPLGLLALGSTGLSVWQREERISKKPRHLNWFDVSRRSNERPI